MVRALAMASVVVGCGGSASSAEPPAVEPVPAEPEPEPSAEVVLAVADRDVTVRVEIARTDPEQERGLMYRRHLSDDAGMLFVYDRMEYRSFWMVNTWIPLDMIFIDADGRVVGVVADTRPLTEDSCEVAGPSQYVLEVNAGFAARHGIDAGTRVRFEGVAEAGAQ